MKNLISLLILVLALQSCENVTGEKTEDNHLQKTVELPKKIIETETIQDTISISEEHNPNFILGELDGDNLSDTVKIVKNTKNGKYGLKIIFGNKKVHYFGMGEEILGQGFDDINWVGIFEKAPKNEIYWNNVNDEGEIIGEEDLKETDKIKLPNDGIFIHQAESCGGGVIYLKDGQFAWIQQE